MPPETPAAGAILQDCGAGRSEKFFGRSAKVERGTRAGAFQLLPASPMKMFRIAFATALTTAPLWLCGCVTRFADSSARGLVVPSGKTRAIVLGFGVVSTSVPVESAVAVIRTQVAGIQISDQPGLKFSLGLASSQTALVPAQSADDVRFEAETATDGRLRVTVGNARLRPHSP